MRPPVRARSAGLAFAALVALVPLRAEAGDPGPALDEVSIVATLERDGTLAVEERWTLSAPAPLAAIRTGVDLAGLDGVDEALAWFGPSATEAPEAIRALSADRKVLWLRPQGDAATSARVARWTYRVRGAITPLAQWDELDWKALSELGRGPARAFRVVVRPPAGTAAAAVRWSVQTGARLSEQTLDADGILVVAGKDLPADSYVKVVLRYTPGTVQTIARVRRPPPGDGLGDLQRTALSLGAVALLLLLYWATRRVRLAAEQQATAPDDAPGAAPPPPPAGADPLHR